MRILLITDNHTPTGGAENYFFDLKSRLKNLVGMEVFSLGFGPQSASGEDFYVLKGLQSKIAKLIWQIVFNPFIYFKLKKQIKEFRPDVIHIHNIKQYSASLLHAIQAYPVIQTIHDYTFICPTGLNLHKDDRVCLSGMQKNCFWQHQTKYNRLIYFAMACSFFFMRKKIKKIVKLFLAPSPLLVIYLQKNEFRNVAYVPPFKLETNINETFPKPYHFLFAGHLGLHKGVHILIDEFALACKQNSKLQLTIAGTGPEEINMRNRINTLQIQNHVQFIGWQTNLQSLYDEHIAILFPSMGLEAFGLVMTEGMHHRRPIIGANRGTASWIIDDNETGFLYDPLKKGELSEKILQMANNIDLSIKLGNKGRDKLNRMFDNDAILNQIVAAYKNLKS